MSLLQKCIELLKQHEYKQELHHILCSVLDVVIEIMRPYLLWICIYIVLQSILWVLMIYVLLKIIF